MDDAPVTGAPEVGVEEGTLDVPVSEGLDIDVSDEEGGVDEEICAREKDEDDSCGAGL